MTDQNPSVAGAPMDPPIDREMRSELRTQRAVAIGLALMFFLAAGLKMAKPHAMHTVIDALFAQHMPASARTAWFTELVASAVVGWEITLAILLVVLYRSTWTLLALIATLLLFTMTLIALAFLPDAPSCGCLGGWPTSVGNARSEVIVGLIRNGALLVLAAWLFWSVRHMPPQKRPERVAAPGPGASPGAGRRPAFTLIELIVTIAVIAVLVSLLIPAIGAVRQEARHASRLSDLRQLTAIVEMYCAQDADLYPTVIAPDGERIGVDWTLGGQPAWSQGYFRANAIAWLDPILNGSFDIPPGWVLASENESPTDQEHASRSLFFLTHAAHASPGYWQGPIPPRHPELLTTQRSHTVRFPSAKGLILSAHPDVFSLDTALPRVFSGRADGSARAAVPKPGGLHERFMNRAGEMPFPTMVTRDGLHGADF